MFMNPFYMVKNSISFLVDSLEISNYKFLILDFWHFPVALKLMSQHEQQDIKSAIKAERQVMAMPPWPSVFLAQIISKLLSHPYPMCLSPTGLYVWPVLKIYNQEIIIVVF